MLIYSMSVSVDGFIADRDNEARSAFADVWCAIPKVIFSHTLDRVVSNARLAQGSVAEEVTAALDATDKAASDGGAGLAAQAFELGLVDELARDLRALHALTPQHCVDSPRSQTPMTRRNRLHALPHQAVACT